MKYSTYQPDPELCDFINCYWTLESEPGENLVKQRIIPDGCMELIVHYGDPYLQYLQDGTSIIQPGCFVFGQITRPLEIMPTGKTEIFAVRFNPDGFIHFATISLKRMQDRAVTPGELYGSEGIDFENEIMGAVTLAERITVCESFLKRRLSNRQIIDKIINDTVTTILESQGQLSVAALSDEMKINRRKLERKFLSAIGISPKQLTKIIRLQKVIKLLATGSFTSLTSLAYEGNYYDQAHFIKDFKEFTGESPKKFYADNLHISSLFSSSE